MKKTIKDLFKLITTIATVAGILYVALAVCGWNNSGFRLSQPIHRSFT